MSNRPKIIAADGHEIAAVHHARGGKRLLIASHGIDSEKTEGGLYENLIHNLPEDYDGLLFDFRGHGDSPRLSSEATIAGEMLDLMAVFDWARERGFRRIDHTATSFGASITILAVDAYDITFLNRVVFWNPVVDYRKTFTNAEEEWGRSFFNQRDTWELSRRAFTTIKDSDFHISALMTQEMLVIEPQLKRWPKKIPALIFHGDRDTAVPFSATKAYAEENQISLIAVRGADHGFDDQAGEVIRQTSKWIAE